VRKSRKANFSNLKNRGLKALSVTLKKAPLRRLEKV
jgi:hypothetical protein